MAFNEITVMFSAARHVHDLCHTDRRQVAVALVREDDAVRQDALNPSGHGRGAAVRRFHKITVKIAIGKNGAANRRNSDRFLAQIHLVQNFGNQAVCHAVCAARAVVRRGIGERFGRE
jgi:hypothetical protein